YNSTSLVLYILHCQVCLKSGVRTILVRSAERIKYLQRKLSHKKNSSKNRGKVLLEKSWRKVRR
ncbi:MAG: hypothetical protein QXK57_07570, partial [Conexivisphaerales archaeon]